MWQRNGLRAMRVMTGEPIDSALSGKKIRSFYNNIVAPGVWGAYSAFGV
jgi:hypothetical protein